MRAPFAFIIGGLNALGKGSQANYCSRYANSALNKMLEASQSFEISQIEGLTSIHDSILFFDNVAYSCQKAFSEELSIELLVGQLTSVKSVGQNILFNIGHMYSDYVNYLYYDWSTVENGDWPFFVFYHIGDFFMRFLYNPTLSDDSENVQN
jgi:hypothetical protein